MYSTISSPYWLILNAVLYNQLTHSYCSIFNAVQSADLLLLVDPLCCTINWPAPIGWSSMLYKQLTCSYWLILYAVQSAHLLLLVDLPCCTISWPAPIGWSSILYNQLTCPYSGLLLLVDLYSGLLLLVDPQVGNQSELVLSVDEEHHNRQLTCGAYNPLLPALVVEDSQILHVLCKKILRFLYNKKNDGFIYCSFSFIF